MKDTKEKSKVSYSTVISTIAILMSVTSFYFTYFRVNHSLKFGFVRAYPHGYVLPDELNVDTILINQGNKTETLLSTKFVLHSGEGKNKTWNANSEKGPLVLKPGDAVPLRLDIKVDIATLESAGNWSGDDNNRKVEAEMAIEVSVVGPNGQERVQLIPLGKLIYSEPSEAVELIYERRKGVNLVELME